MYEILRTPEFDEWLNALAPAATVRVSRALSRMVEGNWGDYKPLAGTQGIFERRLMGRGPGIRLYFCRQGNRIIIILAGGDKATQERRDINRARLIRERYL